VPGPASVYEGVEQHTIEARVLKPDTPAVVLDERVHGGLAWPPRASLVKVHRRSEGTRCCGVNPPSSAPAQAHRRLSHREQAHSAQQPSRPIHYPEGD
jgi:hypothetical protein